MDINKLIEKSYTVSKSCYHKGSMVPNYISGQEYEKWIQLTVRFLEQNFPDEMCPPSKNRHKKASKNEMNRSISLIC